MIKKDDFKANVKESFSKVRNDTDDLKRYIAYFAKEQKEFNHSIYDKFAKVETENIELKNEVKELKKELKSTKNSLKSAIAKLKADVKDLKESQKIVVESVEDSKEELDSMFEEVASLQAETESKKIEDVISVEKPKSDNVETEMVTIVKKKVKTDEESDEKSEASVKDLPAEKVKLVADIPDAINPEIISKELDDFLKSNA